MQTKELIELIEKGFAGIWVKADNNNLPKEEDEYFIINKKGYKATLYASGVGHQNRWKHEVEMWLDTSPETKAALIAALQTKEFEEKSDEEAAIENYKLHYIGALSSELEQDSTMDFLAGCQHIRNTELAAALQQIEEKEKRIDELITRNTLAYKSGYDAATSDANQQIDELKAWKEQAIACMPDFPAIAKALNVPLGQSVPDKILPAIQTLTKEREILRQTATTQIAEVKKTTEALRFCESQQKEKAALMDEMAEAWEQIRDLSGEAFSNSSYESAFNKCWPLADKMLAKYNDLK